MEVDLTATALVNAGGAFLFLLVGLGILVIARGERRGLLVGGMAIFFGLAFIIENLLPNEGGKGGFPVWGYVATTIAAALLATALCWRLGQEAGRPTSRRFAVLAGLVAADALVFVAILLAQERDAPNRWFNFGSFAIRASFFLLVAVVGLRLRANPTGTWRQARGWAWVALAFGLWTTLNVAINFVADASQGDASGLPYAAPLATLLVLFPSTRHGEPRLRRRLFVALVSVALVGLVQKVVALDLHVLGDSPLHGMARAIGAVFLVLAVVKGDVLQVPLPRIAVRRGAIATGALATLFIVAQVAQNFFSARYGLLMGGVLAGGFVFAASPIQRAIERSSGQPKPNAAAPGSAVTGYKAALRAAMRDGTLTRREERHLAEVAMALGISAVQALDLRDEVEREHAEARHRTSL